MCYLHCKYARGRQIRGCIFVFIQQTTNNELPPVFVDNTNNKTYTLESGTYSYTVHDWDGTDQWIDSYPADTGQITVERDTIGTCNHYNNYDCYYSVIFSTDDNTGEWRIFTITFRRIFITVEKIIIGCTLGAVILLVIAIGSPIIVTIIIRRVRNNRQGKVLWFCTDSINELLCFAFVRPLSHWSGCSSW